MLKENELRLGELRVGITLNIFPFEKVGFNPVTIDAQRLIALLKGNETTYHPIPLTPEILVMYGFEKKLVLGSTDKYWYSIGELSYNESHKGWWFRGKLKDIDYLHQLQNLYFSLTGEELIIKEK